MSEIAALTDKEKRERASRVRQEQIRERFRRLHARIEDHPHMSGMQTNDHQQMLLWIWYDTYSHLGAYPGEQDADYEKELDVDDFDVWCG